MQADKALLTRLVRVRILCMRILAQGPIVRSCDDSDLTVLLIDVRCRLSLQRILIV